MKLKVEYRTAVDMTVRQQMAMAYMQAVVQSMTAWETPTQAALKEVAFDAFWMADQMERAENGDAT